MLPAVCFVSSRCGHGGGRAFCTLRRPAACATVGASYAASACTQSRRGLFGRKKPSPWEEARAEQAAAEMVTSTVKVEPLTPPVVTSAVCQTATARLAELQTHAAHLELELKHSKEVIRQLVALVDRQKHAAELAKLSKSLEGGGGLFVAENSEMLAAALRTPGARIVLLENQRYILDLFNPVVIRRTTVSIIGNHATVVGAIVVDDKATLDVTDVFFCAPNGLTGKPQLRRLAPGEDRPTAFEVFEEEKQTKQDKAYCCANTQLLPILSATNNSHIFARGCSLVSGRDGVYLGISSRAELSDTHIWNCIRGVYEGVGCGVTCTPDCDFKGNYYQLVLLGPDKEARSARMLGQGTSDPPVHFAERAEPGVVCPPGFACQRPVWLRRARADIVLQHDPIADVYSDCWKDGHTVELDEKQRTAGLSDPVY